MKVLTVLPQSLLAGAPLAALRLARELSRTGHAVQAICARPGPVADLLAQAGLGPTDSNAAGRTTTQTSSSYAPIRMARSWFTLRRLRPDLLHLHSACGLCRDWAWAAKLAGVPVVWHLHEDLSFPRYRRHLGAVRRLAGRTVAVARVQLPFLDPRRSVWVPNGVDCDSFRPPDPGEREQARLEFDLEQEDFAVLALGRICADKGSFLLLETLREAFAQAPNLRLLMAGAGGPGDRERAWALAAAAPPGCVRLLPARSDVVRLLQAADLLVLPSRRENCPLVVLEAMASGLPVLATPVGDVPFLLDGGRAGALLPADLTISALARALSSAAAGGPPRRAQEGKRGHERVKARFSLARQANTIIDVYKGLLTETGKNEAS